jgi:hypothetical protein
VERGPPVYTHGLRDVNRILVRGDWDHEAHRPRVPLACVKPGIIIARHVPAATHHIIDVVAETGRRGCILATTEAKLVGSDEILPCEKSIGKLPAQ